MRFVPSHLKDAAVVEMETTSDERGYFGRVWIEDDAAKAGYPARFVVTSLSYNAKAGTLRGMHYQVAPHGEVKLVRCIRGAVYDVMIDLRPDSPTYKQWHGEELTAANHRALYIPIGFAHGFITLTSDAEVFYQLSAGYVPSAGAGVRYNDPAFGVHWPGTLTVINDRDRNYPDFNP